MYLGISRVLVYSSLSTTLTPPFASRLNLRARKSFQLYARSRKSSQPFCRKPLDFPAAVLVPHFAVLSAMTAKRYEVKLLVRRLEGWKVGIGEAGGDSLEEDGFFVELEWADDEDLGLGKNRRGERLNSTRVATMGEDGVFSWDDEFRKDCLLSELSDDEGLQESEIKLKVFSTCSGKTPRTQRRLELGTTSICLSEWASTEEGKVLNLSLPLIQTRNICGTDLLLCITLSFSKKIVVYTRRAKHSGHDKGGSVNGMAARNNDSDLLLHHNQLHSNDFSVAKNDALEASLSELVKGCIPSSAKRKRSDRGSKNRREHPAKVISIEDSEDELESSCKQLSYSQPLQQKWQQINVVSRDALMKIETQILFASIDQRSEQAGGSSACSALVVVMANWLHANKGCLPNQCQFDTLIKEGSREWRELQKNGGLMQQYADGHFDIRTVLHLRPICVDSAKTTIGFFQPEGLPKEVLEFLPGTTSFEDLWKEISEARAQVSGNDSLIYIVGWNDHFFLLKADSEAYYLIDTLGERLFEGCDRGYILKFDKQTKICKNQSQDMEESSDKEDETETEILFSGHECCKHYFQSFLAGLPLKEAIENNKNGMLTLDRLYGKIQIEFSYTKTAVNGCRK